MSDGGTSTLTELKEAQLKIKSQCSQLTYMLNENDSLKEQIDQLKASLDLS